MLLETISDYLKSKGWTDVENNGEFLFIYYCRHKRMPRPLSHLCDVFFILQIWGHNNIRIHNDHNLDKPVFGIEDPDFLEKIDKAITLTAMQHTPQPS